MTTTIIAKNATTHNHRSTAGAIEIAAMTGVANQIARTDERNSSHHRKVASAKITQEHAASEIQQSKGTTADPVTNKTKLVLKKLRTPRGATVKELIQVTGWQAHSVRGFVSAVVKKRLGLNLVSETGKDGVRRYRIDDAASMSK